MRGREFGGEGAIQPLAILCGIEPPRQRRRTGG
jgi:hypothetical protein